MVSRNMDTWLTSAHSTVKPVLRGYPREGLLKTGGILMQVHLHCILGQGT